EEQYTFVDLKGSKGETGDKGWSPIYITESDGNDKEVLKITGYVGGEGDAPTENIGYYLSENGFTADISEATNIKGDALTEGQKNLLEEYDQERIDKTKFIFKVSTIAGDSKTVELNRRGGDDFTVDWGDGTENESLSHTYAEEGVYTVVV